MSIRRIVTATMGALALMTLVASGALVVLTTLLHRAALSLEASVDGVRLADQASIDLLIYGRAQDEFVRSELERRLQRRLDELERYVSSAHESEAFADARRKVEAYLAAPSGDTGSESPSVEAYTALARLVDINVAQARAASARAALWDRAGNAVAIGVGVALVTSIVLLLWWLRTVAFHPFLTLIGTIQRFGAGEREVRAPEAGPTELGEVARYFNEMADTLTRQREEQLTFLASVAHDLRNPLAALRSAGSVLHQACGEQPLPERVRQIAVTIHRQVLQMDRLVGDLLETARMEAAILELNLEVHDLRELVQEVATLYQGASLRHEVTAQTPTTPVFVSCDAGRITQVLENLVNNAIKYSPDGGPVVLLLVAGDMEAVLEVSDRGLGIDPGECELIFEPFRRASTTRDSIPGIGLGLHVVRRIVTAHGGVVECESTPGQGSMFRIRLPLPNGLDRRMETGGEGPTFAH